MNKFDLGKGGVFFLYTDGAPEATRSDEEMFSEDRMIALLNEHADSSPKELFEAMKTGIDEFVGD